MWHTAILAWGELRTYDGDAQSQRYGTMDGKNVRRGGG